MPRKLNPTKFPNVVFTDGVKLLPCGCDGVAIAVAAKRASCVRHLSDNILPNFETSSILRSVVKGWLMDKRGGHGTSFYPSSS